MDTQNNLSMIRTDVWSQEIKDILQEELLGDRLARWVTENLPDGNVLHIPTLSELVVRPYAEKSEITLDDISTGDFELHINKYHQCGFIVYDAFKHDSFYINELLSNFVSKITRGLIEQKETELLALGTDSASASLNIQGGEHHLVGSATGNVIALKDIAKAKFALDKARVSKVGRIAIVDPAVSYQLVNIDNVIRQDVYGANANLKEGLSGTIMLGRYLGFDFYESNLLNTYASGATVGGVATTADGVYNIFLGNEALIGAMRLEPEIEFFRIPEKKADAYHGTIRYGLDVFRPEAQVIIATANSVA